MAELETCTVSFLIFWRLSASLLSYFFNIMFPETFSVRCRSVSLHMTSRMTVDTDTYGYLVWYLPFLPVAARVICFESCDVCAPQLDRRIDFVRAIPKSETFKARELDGEGSGIRGVTIQPEDSQSDRSTP